MVTKTFELVQVSSKMHQLYYIEGDVICCVDVILLTSLSINLAELKK